MEKKDLRIIFMGTPEFAVGTLDKLVTEGYNVVAVVTQPDKPVGRHQDCAQPSQVKLYAEAHQLPVLQPEKMKDPVFIKELQSFQADLQVVVAFRMLPEIVWAMPKFGTFNVHAALLPQYRGAAPINWAIINGEKITGVTTFFLDQEIDTGHIILQKEFLIPETADVEYVYNGLMQLGAEAAVETIDRILSSGGNIESTDQSVLIHSMALQSGELRLAPKIFKDTCEINWNQPAKRVYDFIRGLSPYPGAWSASLILKTGNSQMEQLPTIKIYQAQQSDKTCDEKPGTLIIEGKHLYVACVDCWLEIRIIQPAGKKRMNAIDFINGKKNHR
ncbi:methionyl-tRNA formyltransferase [Prevotella sp. A2931]|uniref:Methionyl-tRNA formyltransferase n=1 Tax=Prevotella illustrans TaxID=2800387 RepID=A0ABS3M534_9BACT|nr:MULTISPECIES: methionyl-tRNA formyltransferase [Prevotella]MBO1363282.1 methionyl-tRNA formyltransferase [Prevotella illustrans]PTL25844.1 methionyl-tRNA formyltransferase [Prevotella sp. oral taxon 820]